MQTGYETQHYFTESITRSDRSDYTNPTLDVSNLVHLRTNSLSIHGLRLRSTTESDTDMWSEQSFLRVSVDTVRDHFERFQMLDANVRFVKGFFARSLLVLRKHFQDEGRHISVLRGDGDMFESFYDILFKLYEFVPVGGYVILDDGTHPPSQRAVADFMCVHAMTEEVIGHPNNVMTHFKKTRDVQVQHRRP